MFRLSIIMVFWTSKYYLLLRVWFLIFGQQIREEGRMVNVIYFILYTLFERHPLKSSALLYLKKFLQSFLIYTTCFAQTYTRNKLSSGSLFRVSYPCHSCFFKFKYHAHLILLQEKHYF